MVVFNIKIDKKSVFKTILAIMFIICITLCIIGAYMLFTSNSKNELTQINDDIPSNDIAELTAENYTNVLQEVHKDIDTYIGQTINYSEYQKKLAPFYNEKLKTFLDTNLAKVD